MLGELMPCGGGDPIPLMKSKLSVGRKDFCDIVLRYANVSSRHCELELNDGYWFIRDLGSTNGIRVNGSSCDSQCLMPGDEVWIARYRYNIHYTIQSNQLPPQENQRPYEELKQGLLEKAGLEVVGDQLVDRPVSSTSASRNASLGQLVPSGGGDPINLLETILVVGRHPKCDIVLRFENVSARHCEFEFIDGYWLVRDLGSRNGIRVDGVRVESQSLKPGDVISIASHRYELHYTPLGDGPPPDANAASFARSLLEKAGLSRRKRK